MPNKLVYVGFAYSHHNGTHAGYHQIKEYLNYDYYVDCQSWYDKSHIASKSIYTRLKYRLLRRFFKEPAIPWFVLKIIVLGLLHDDLIFHFIYAENNFFPEIKKYIRKGNKIVCTFHQPLNYFKSNVRQMEKLRTADKIILVANAEILDFEEVLHKKNVVYIPHGICTDFYKPEDRICKSHMLLTVGNWLRDYVFANKVYQRLLAMDSTLQICVVSQAKNKKMISQNDRIHFLSGISDEQLKELYCKSSVLFLPLTRYTANNSLLEAGATGCNIVISSNHPDNSYIPSQFLTLCPMDVDMTVNAIYNLCNINYNSALAKFVREKYSWATIAIETKKVLSSFGL